MEAALAALAKNFGYVLISCGIALPPQGALYSAKLSCGQHGTAELTQRDFGDGPTLWGMMTTQGASPKVTFVSLYDRQISSNMSCLMKEDHLVTCGDTKALVNAFAMRITK